MKTAEKVGLVLLTIGLFLVMLAAWLAYSIFIGFNKVPELIPGLASDSNLALSNSFLFFFVLAIITWTGSIITSRGVTLIKEVNLKVLKNSYGVEAEAIARAVLWAWR
jgi:hypothetical protein